MNQLLFSCDAVWDALSLEERIDYIRAASLDATREYAWNHYSTRARIAATMRECTDALLDLYRLGVQTVMATPPSVQSIPRPFTE